MRTKARHARRWLVMLTLALCTVVSGHSADWPSPLHYINTSFENASPLYWEVGPDGVVHVHLVYDQERSSPNRANGHWLFEIQATPGAELTLLLHNFDNVWNGRKGSPLDDRTIGFFSEDGSEWHPARLKKTTDNALEVPVTVRTGRLYAARLEPYRLSDLESFKERIQGHEAIDIRRIGRTVEGRELEIIRVGRARTPNRVLLRARAHPWEPGGNWVVQGLIERLLRDDADARRYLRRYCVYVMPMANKDGVVRGRTRFNMLGADLNRRWDKPADPQINPENHAFETWLESVVREGYAPQLMIDLHNDNYGRLHISRPDTGREDYLAKMLRLEAMLREYTWFTEGSTTGSIGPGSIGHGLLERFGIDACVLELNANWIAGLSDYPSAANWELFGVQLCEALYHYFEGDTPAACQGS